MEFWRTDKANKVAIDVVIPFCMQQQQPQQKPQETQHYGT